MDQVRRIGRASQAISIRLGRSQQIAGVVVYWFELIATETHPKNGTVSDVNVPGCRSKLAMVVWTSTPTYPRYPYVICSSEEKYGEKGVKL